MTQASSSEPLLSDPIEPTFRDKLRALKHRLSPREYYRRHKRNVILYSLLAVFLLVFVAPHFLVRVPAGHVGAIWRPLFGGTDPVGVILEGQRIVSPWNEVTLYDTRLLVEKRQFDAITADGLNVKLKVTYRFRLHPSKVGLAHKTVGPDYIEKLISPAIGMVVRAEVAKFTVHQVYGPSRKSIQDRIFADVVDPSNRNMIEATSDADAPEGAIMLGRRLTNVMRKNRSSEYSPMIELVDVLINEVVLPARVATAIEKKQEQEQLKEEYVFRLERERMESTRKEIEADGIARCQQKGQAGISQNYLKWRGIEATLSLATSENAKTVIIGGKDGLPLILNTDEASSARPKSSAKGKLKPASTKAAASSSIDLGRTTGAP